MAEEVEMTPNEPSTKLTDVEAQVDPDMDEDNRKQKDLERTLWTRIWQGIAIACVVLSLVAMIYETGSAVVVIMGLFAFAVSGAVFYFQFQLEDMDCELPCSAFGIDISILCLELLSSFSSFWSFNIFLLCKMQRYE
jgi:uncharacterized membrane protein